MIKIKNITECPTVIKHTDGFIGNTNLLYKCIIIGDTRTDNYTIYTNEEWNSKVEKCINQLVTLLDKVRTEEGLEPTGEIKGLPIGLKYMADLIILDGKVEKNRY